MKVVRKIEPNSREQSKEGSRQERESGAVGEEAGTWKQAMQKGANKDRTFAAGSQTILRWWSTLVQAV